MPKKSLYSTRYDRFLELLKSMRTDAGLSQTEAAVLLGRPQSFISKCESGERRVDAVELLDFCKVYSVLPESFIKKLTQ